MSAAAPEEESQAAAAAPAASADDVAVDVPAEQEGQEEQPSTPANLEVEVEIKKDPKGLGLVIGLSKKSASDPDRPQVIFIRQLQRRADGTQSEAVKDGNMMPQDVVLEVNGTPVGTELSVLTEVINAVPIDGPIRFKLERRWKDEKRRIKAMEDQAKALELDVTLRAIFNKIDTSGDGTLSLQELDEAGTEVYADKLGLHLPAGETFTTLKEFAAHTESKITFRDFRGIMYGPELAVRCRHVRFARYAVLFKELDQDQSGQLSLEEVVAAGKEESGKPLLTKLFGEHADALVQHFADADTNNDGQLSWDEFTQTAEEFYQKSMHPNAYEALEEEVSFTREEADEKAVQETSATPAAPTPKSASVKAIPSAISLKADADAEEESAGAGAAESKEDDEEMAKARQQIEQQRAEDEEAAAKAHVEAQKKKKQEEEAAAQRREEERIEAAKRRDAEQKARDENAAQAPKQGGCCTIA